MRDGRISAVGATQQLYQRPPNRYVAEFLGHANLLPVRLAAAGAELADVLFGDVPLRVAHGDASTFGADALLCVRPHALRLLDGGSTAPGNALHGTVEAVLWQGDQQLLRVACGDTRLRISAPPAPQPPRVGDVVRFGFAPRDACLVRSDAARDRAA
jgi:2-aminoethylphosphonate transport system ATP-binding protein